MHYIISVLICLMASCVASKAWYNRFDNAVYGGWAPDRRSIKGDLQCLSCPYVMTQQLHDAVKNKTSCFQMKARDSSGISECKTSFG